MEIGEGIVLDVNSLYPDVLYNMPMPYGEGKYFSGQYEKDEQYNIYVQMFTCNFELKEGFIPTIQLKNNLSFVPTEYLKSSEGEDITMCLTYLDLELFLKHYNVYNMDYIGGWKFKSTTKLFKDYIDKWIGVKIQATLDGNKPLRTLAKLMLNALYGKFALNPNVRSKYPVLHDGVVHYALGPKETRPPIYIPVGTMTTAGARYKTINAAQTVYDRFIYADTDSLHLEGTEIPSGLEIDNVKLGAWKHESTFRRAKFLRQKCYLEDIYMEEKDIQKLLQKNPELKNLVNYEKGSMLHITCAGMPKSCYSHVTWENFDYFSQFNGKLRPKHVQGGIVLVDTTFTIKG